MNASTATALPSPHFRLLPLVAAIAAIAGPICTLAANAQTTDSAILPAVIITAPRLPAGRAQASVAGISDSPIESTPISIGTVSAEELSGRGVNNLSSAMRYQPAVSDAYNTLGYIESLSIRGLPLNNATNFRRDGMPISNHSPLALENKERIESLMGVSGMQSGVSAPGGLVNYVLKRPTASNLREVGLRFSERGTANLNADFGGRNEDKTFGYRVNAALENRRPMVDNAPGKRQFLSGFFELQFDQRNQLELDFEHHRSKQISVPGFGLLDTNGDGIAETLPPVINPRTNLNAQSWSQPFESVSTVAGIRYEHKLGDDWRLGVRANHQLIKTNDRLAFPDGCSSGSNYVYPGLCANYDVDLYDYRSENERRKMRSGDLYASGKLQTGALKHEVNAALRLTRYSERYEAFQAYNYTGTINALAPTAVTGDGTKLDKNTLLNSDTKELSLSDVITINDSWSTWLGVRHTRLARSSVRTDGSRPTNYTQSFTTPWASLTFKTGNGGMAYVSAGEGVESEVVPNRPSLYSNFGQALPALKSRQIELGFKQTIQLDNQRKGLFSAALFQVTQTRASDVPDAAPASTSTRVADGMRLRHRGVEISYAGALSPSLTTQLSATALDAKVVEDANNLLVGKRTSNVAPLSLAGQITWHVASAWQWRNGLTYFSSKPVGNDNITKLPSAWQLDTNLSYANKIGGTAYTWQAGIDNLLDRRYWREAPTQYWGGTYLYPAQGRTLRVSLNAKF
jgi:iron complex outermembrane recepter protein